MGLAYLKVGGIGTIYGHLLADANFGHAKFPHLHVAHVFLSFSFWDTFNAKGWNFLSRLSSLRIVFLCTSLIRACIIDIINVPWWQFRWRRWNGLRGRWRRCPWCWQRIKYLLWQRMDLLCQQRQRYLNVADLIVQFIDLLLDMLRESTRGLANFPPHMSTCSYVQWCESETCWQLQSLSLTEHRLSSSNQSTRRILSLNRD